MRFMAKNIAVIGDSESVKGFRAIGLDIYVCSGSEQAAKILRNIVDTDEYAVIYITEEYYNTSGKEISRCENRLTPALIPIPGVKGNSGTGVSRLSSFVEKAVGSDILFKGNTA